MNLTGFKPNHGILCVFSFCCVHFLGNLFSITHLVLPVSYFCAYQILLYTFTISSNIDWHPITKVSKTKFFGVIIDNKIKWNEHITYIGHKISWE